MTTYVGNSQKNNNNAGPHNIHCHSSVILLPLTKVSTIPRGFLSLSTGQPRQLQQTMQKVGSVSPSAVIREACIYGWSAAVSTAVVQRWEGPAVMEGHLLVAAAAAFIASSLPLT